MGLKHWAESFQAYDIDGDGFITKDDFGVLGARLNSAAGVESHLGNLWTFLAEGLDENHDGKISPSEWTRAWENLQAAGGYSDLPEWYRQYCEWVFETLDTDGDGQVTEAEYNQFLQFFGRKAYNGTFSLFHSADKSTINRVDFESLIHGMSTIEDPRFARFWGQSGTE